MSITPQQLDENIKRNQKIVDFGESLERLRSNRDFKKLILDGYFREEGIRLVHLKGDPNMQSPEHQKAIIAAIDSIGNLSAYFRVVDMQAKMANREILADEQTRVELLEGDE